MDSSGSHKDPERKKTSHNDFKVKYIYMSTKTMFPLEIVWSLAFAGSGKKS